MANAAKDVMPEGIFSFLDTDLYKLTMQCAVLKYFPKVQVAYKYTNRTPHKKLTHGAFKWLQPQIQKLENIVLSEEELTWLKKTCPYLSAEYLDYLKTFRLKPAEQVKVTFTTSDHSGEDSEPGELHIETHGLWLETILYEIPLLALVSEAYFKHVDTSWNHDGQIAKGKHKALQLLSSGCSFSEFGSRRRRDYSTHEMVIQGICEAVQEAEKTPSKYSGKFTGTSNVHMAMRFGLQPVGTVAHEWFMGIAALTGDYSGANEKALQYWIGTFGRGVLGIALTDTFGTPSFLKAFARPAPKSHTAETEVDWADPSYAQIFTGVRQDSGDPLNFIQMMRTFYDSQGITEAKTIVFSDSLNVERCIEYKHATEAVGLTPSFGVGTYFTNDFWDLRRNEKSVPLNIVIKISEVEGKPAVKLSDDRGKNTGASKLVERIKEEVGYTEKTGFGDEAHRWDK